jgi:hypothetical protein
MIIEVHANHDPEEPADLEHASNVPDGRIDIGWPREGNREA